MKLKSTHYTLLTILSLSSIGVMNAQTQILAGNTYQTFASAGTTNGAASDGANVRLYSAVGQSIAISSAITTTPQTQAGVLSAYATGFFVSDNISPSITTASPPASFKSGDTFSTSVTDNVMVEGAKIHFKPIAASPASGSDSLALTAGASNAYTIGIQNSSKTLYDAMGIQYYYTAFDEKGNYKRDPLTGFYYSYQNSAGATVPATLLSAGEAISNYSIIAMPYSSSTGDAISTIFGTSSGLPDITDANGVNWKLGHYDNTAGIDSVQAYSNNLKTFNRGVGYWFIQRKNNTINIGQVTSPQNNRSSLFQLKVTDGWNQVGNPYPVDINWSDVQNLQGNANVGALKVWTGGWSNGTTLSAFQGGFVKNTGTSTWKIPFQGQTAEGSRVVSNLTSTNISDDLWKVELDIFQDETFNKLGGFGMAPNSISGVDALDDYNPPSFLDSPEIDFEITDGKERMCQSIVGLGSEYVWKFKAKGSIGKLTELTWSTNLGPGFEQLYLVDETQARVIDMRQQSNYGFTLASNHQFSVYFGKDALRKIAASQLVISSPYPNPVLQNQTTFNLGLPDVGNHYNVNVQIFNSAGIAVSGNIINFEPGIRSVIWQPNDNSAGMYFYRLTVNSNNVNVVSTGKIIVP